jgi:hypothetical protein
MSIVILEAWTQKGWDPCDHLIDDSKLDEVIGKSYATVEHAKRAVESRADRRGFASFIYRDRNGRRYKYDTSANLKIPGRSVLRITEVG